MKILVTGGTGQVGQELIRTLAPLGEVLAPPRQVLDLADLDRVDAYLQAHQPALIVNAAAYTGVDAAESEKKLADRLNHRLPARLARYASDNAARLIHYSSDYVYPGEGDRPWHETDTPAPLSVYGATKLDGDRAVEESGARHLILRTSWVYGHRGRNFMNTMLRLGCERDHLGVVNDQIGAPTPAQLIATVTALMIRPWEEGTLADGVYHLATRGATSWHGFAQEIFRLAAGADVPLRIDPEAVGGIPTSDYPTPAARPLNSRLALDKLENALKVTLPDWHSQLTLTLQDRLQGNLISDDPLKGKAVQDDT